MLWYFGVRYNERMGVPSNTSAVEKKAVGIATNRQKLIVWIAKFLSHPMYYVF